MTPGLSVSISFSLTRAAGGKGEMEISDGKLLVQRVESGVAHPPVTIELSGRTTFENNGFGAQISLPDGFILAAMARISGGEIEELMRKNGIPFPPHRVDDKAAA